MRTDRRRGTQTEVLTGRMDRETDRETDRQRTRERDWLTVGQTYLGTKRQSD